MLFCKELNTVELDNNGAITKIIRKQSQQLENEIGISEFEITGINPRTRKFLHKKIKDRIISMKDPIYRIIMKPKTATLI
jgi:hypothetical protein